MTTQPAPLLTATMATDCVPADNLNADAYYARRVALQALADGRTACVRVLTEGEHRYHGCIASSGEDDTFMAGYLACARANGLVKP